MSGEKAGAMRQVFNTAVQGSVADLQKMFIKQNYHRIKQIGGRFVTTVFDSFLVRASERLSGRSQGFYRRGSRPASG